MVLGGAFGLLAFGLMPPAVSQTGKKAASAPKVYGFTKDARPFLTKYCIRCHSGESPAAGVALDKETSEAGIPAHQKIWDRVASNVGSMHMPPSGMPQPPKAERAAFVSWVQSKLANDCKLADPGRVTMRRLNRQEYDNTVRDLTGLDLHLSDDFPADDVGYGFDNIGDVLSISPLLMEKYLNAAEKIANAAIYVPPPAERYDVEQLKPTGAVQVGDHGFVLYSTGAVSAVHDFPHPGMYRVRIEAFQDAAGPEPAKMAVALDKETIDPGCEVKATEGAAMAYEFPVRVATAGKHTVSATFTNDYYQAGPPAQDRNLNINWMEVAPVAVTPSELPDAEKRIMAPAKGMGETPKAAETIVRAFATRAYRRPATPDEVQRLSQIYSLTRKDGETFEKAIQVCVQAILSSPNFLFRVERDNGQSNLDSYEIASRLSYFLWQSLPDDRLMRLAASGDLQQPAIVQAEAKRMLADPRSKALADGFASQWLNLRKLANAAPDPKQFPDYDDKLRDAMATETRMFFDGVVRNDRSVIDLLGGQYTYVNGRLAKLYGIPNVEGDQFRKVSLVGTPRSGVFTQASVLTLTSNPTRTSPTKRGKWILDELFNQPPPPPPPGVGDLAGDGKVITGATLRIRMEQHRKDPACAVCHMRMDPLGFSLENFDAIGKWRTEDAGAPIDSSGVLPDGQKFKGPQELRGILLSRKDEFVKALSDKMLTYAMGRGTEISDRCYVDSISEATKKGDYKFSSLVAAIVASPPFRTRHAIPTAVKKPAISKGKGAK